MGATTSFPAVRRTTTTPPARPSVRHGSGPGAVASALAALCSALLVLSLVVAGESQALATTSTVTGPTTVSVRVTVVHRTVRVATAYVAAAGRGTRATSAHGLVAVVHADARATASAVATVVLAGESASAHEFAVGSRDATARVAVTRSVTRALAVRRARDAAMRAASAAADRTAGAAASASAQAAARLVLSRRHPSPTTTPPAPAPTRPAGSTSPTPSDPPTASTGPTPSDPTPTASTTDGSASASPSDSSSGTPSDPPTASPSDSSTPSTSAAPTPSATPTSTPTSTPSASPTGSTPAPNPSGVPTGDLPGWKLAFADDFTTNAPLGSFLSTYSSRWSAYPAGWLDTSGNGHYDPAKTLSVSNGNLDIYLHTVNGVHYVSAPTPKLPTMTYGRYSIRFQSDSMPGYKTAWLLWPDDDVWPAHGEIDFPEGNLDSTISAFAHWASSGGGQDAFSTSATYAAWHTATTEWTPGRITFLLDGKVVGTSTRLVPSAPMHWVIQSETQLSGGAPAASVAGHVRIDWAAAWTYAP